MTFYAILFPIPPFPILLALFLLLSSHIVVVGRRGECVVYVYESLRHFVSSLFLRRSFRPSLPSPMGSTVHIREYVGGQERSAHV